MVVHRVIWMMEKLPFLDSRSGVAHQYMESFSGRTKAIQAWIFEFGVQKEK